MSWMKIIFNNFSDWLMIEKLSRLLSNSIHIRILPKVLAVCHGGGGKQKVSICYFVAVLRWWCSSSLTNTYSRILFLLIYRHFIIDWPSPHGRWTGPNCYLCTRWYSWRSNFVQHSAHSSASRAASRDSWPFLYTVLCNFILLLSSNTVKYCGTLQTDPHVGSVLSLP